MKKSHDVRQHRLTIRMVPRSVSRMVAAQEVQRIKHNFKTSHKRPPGPSADKYIREHWKLNQNTGSQRFREFPEPPSGHLLNIHTSAGFEAPMSGGF